MDKKRYNWKSFAKNLCLKIDNSFEKTIGWNPGILRFGKSIKKKISLPRFGKSIKKKISLPPVPDTYEMAPIFFKTLNMDLSERDVYEFGTCAGRSMKVTADFYKKNNCKIRKMFGFDSFEGLPEEKNDPYAHPSWYRGAFSAEIRFKTKDKTEIMKKVLEVIGPREHEILLIPGFYDKVLRDDLVRKYDMRPASFVNIDCDIYTSAYLALDFMFRNNLITKNTFIRYDDWGGTPEYKGGESRAHKEIQKKYNVNFKLIYRKDNNPPNITMLYRIKSIG